MIAPAAEYRAAARANPSVLIEQHAELVRRIAHHLSARLPASVDIDDLIQGGMLGLIEAARGFDPDQGASFETYASIRIRGAMIDEIRRGDWVPRSVHRSAREAAAAIARVEQANGRAATAEEVAGEMGLALPDYLRLLDNAARGHVFSLDAHVEDAGELPDLRDGGPGPARLHEREAFARQLAEEIDGLPERERLVLSLYYEQELNLREIGAVLGVSESRVCQIHGQAVLRLRGRLGAFRGVGGDLDNA